MERMSNKVALLVIFMRRGRQRSSSTYLSDNPNSNSRANSTLSLLNSEVIQESGYR